MRSPAVIACNITNGHMPHGSNKIYTDSFPNATHFAVLPYAAARNDRETYHTFHTFLGRWNP